MGLVKQIASETEPLVDLRRKHFYELTVCKYCAQMLSGK